MSESGGENWKKYFDDKLSKELPTNFQKKYPRLNLYKFEQIQEILLLANAPEYSRR